MNEIALKETVSAIFSSNRGILATDATADTMDKRMTASETAPTPELRVKFREVLLTTPGISEFIGGVILNDEIIRAKTSGGENFFDLLDKQGIKVGIKLDKKTHDMANFPGEKIAEGLDGLRDRLKEYKDMKASFAKFRTVYLINDTTPSQANIESNSEVLARYAALCQEAGIVPIVEPEILKYIPGGFSDFGKDILPKLVKEGKLFSSEHKGYVFDIGTLEDLEKAREFLRINN